VRNNQLQELPTILKFTQQLLHSEKLPSNTHQAIKATDSQTFPVQAIRAVTEAETAAAAAAVLPQHQAAKNLPDGAGEPSTAPSGDQTSTVRLLLCTLEGIEVAESKCVRVNKANLHLLCAPSNLSRLLSSDT
jgi:hypothetical protein